MTSQRARVSKCRRGQSPPSSQAPEQEGEPDDVPQQQTTEMAPTGGRKPSRKSASATASRVQPSRKQPPGITADGQQISTAPSPISPPPSSPTAEPTSPNHEAPKFFTKNTWRKSVKLPTSALAKSQQHKISASLIIEAPLVQPSSPPSSPVIDEQPPPPAPRKKNQKKRKEKNPSAPGDIASDQPPAKRTRGRAAQAHTDSTVEEQRIGEFRGLPPEIVVESREELLQFDDARLHTKDV